MDWTEVLGISVGIITIVAAIYGITQFIDWRIERKIREEPFLRKISASLHPTVIFDEGGSILYDQGAMQIINKIEINRQKDKHSLPEEIVINPKRHLAHAPLLQTLENELIDVSATRGKGFEWRYRLDYQMYNDVFNDKRRFRLEVLV
jgi:hypothetical protein